MKRFILGILVFSVGVISFAQDTLYYSKSSEIVSTKLEAEFYELIFKTDTLTQVLKYSTEDILISEKNYAVYSDSNDIKNGLSKYYYETGELQVLENYEKDLLEGELKVYYKSGVLQRIEKYKKGELLEGKCFDELCNEIPFFERQTHPKYIGGVNAMYQFISENFIFSKKMIKYNLQGKIFISFVIDKNGDIKDVKVTRGIHQLIDDEAIRVIKSMPRWTPGSVDGKPVSCRFMIPLSIKHK